MRFEVLGPVRMVGASTIPLSAHRRHLLAAFLSRPNHAVRSDRLADILWSSGGRAPVRPDKSLHMHIHRLRRALDRPDRLQATSDGYALLVEAGELDAAVFSDGLVQARVAVTDGRLDDAVTEFRRALALWRGEPYADAGDIDLVRPEAARLVEARLTAYEALYDAELGRGAHREIVPELTERVAEYPLRERLTAQLMRALHQSGRHARALATYRQAQRRLSERLQTRPGAELRALHREIEADRTSEDATPDAPEPAVAFHPPRQLPAPPAVFVGRAKELGELDSGWCDDHPATIVVTGMAGVGKTAIALNFARTVADRFGDGQLYLDLRGHATGPALEPGEALARLLRGLGADPARIPSDVDAAAAEYRSLIAGRRILVFLDNAASADQLRPLLSAAPGTVTLVTSRFRLLGLHARHDVRSLRLNMLAPAECEELLARILGRERTSREASAITDLARACAHLPLALRIAAAHLVDQPDRPVADYVAELRAAPVATLAIEGDDQAAVAAAFDVSYQRLDDDTRRLFRLLGLAPGQDVTADAAAALIGADPSEGRLRLRRLEAAHLVMQAPTGRYRLHDLLRDYAASRAAAEETPADRLRASDRLMAWYYRGNTAATGRFGPASTSALAPDLPPGVPAVGPLDAEAGASWSRAEHHNITAAVRHAAESDRPHWTWHLALGHCLGAADSGYVADAASIATIAVQAARDAGDAVALAHATAQLGTVQARIDARQAVATLTEAVRLAEANDDRALLAYGLNNLGVYHQNLGELDAADTFLRRAYEIKRTDGHRRSAQATTLNNLARLACMRGELRRGAQMFGQALDLMDDVHTATGVNTLINREFTRVLLGETDESLEILDRAGELASRLADQTLLFQTSNVRASLYRQTGRFDLARQEAVRAGERAERSNLPRHRAQAGVALGLACLGLGDHEDARTALDRALATARRAGEREPEADALTGLARLDVAVGQVASARSYADQAVAAARTCGRLKEADALVASARAHLADDRPKEATTIAADALAIHRALGYRFGQAHALQVLDQAQAATGDPSAGERLREADRLFAACRLP